MARRGKEPAAETSRESEPAVDPLIAACPRCTAAVQQPCSSVGPDSYARGAPLKRAHPERYAAARAALAAPSAEQQREEAVQARLREARAALQQNVVESVRPAKQGPTRGISRIDDPTRQVLEHLQRAVQPKPQRTTITLHTWNVLDEIDVIAAARLRDEMRLLQLDVQEEDDGRPGHRRLVVELAQVYAWMARKGGG